jgi:hypothetical protein
MATVGAITYVVVSGTVAGIAAFNTAVEAQIALGYAPLGAPYTDGTGIWQTMFIGSAASFVSEYAITAVDNVGPVYSFTVAGDQTQNFNPGYKFTVTRSTGNNGVYTVVSSVYGVATVITVEEVVVSAVVDGFVEGWSPSVGP